jgi:hypothetical protein
MTAETKLSVSYKSEAMPPVYATDFLNIGEQGALVVYNKKVTTKDDKGVSTTTNDLSAVAFRFAIADEALSDDNFSKVAACVPDLLSAYTKTDTIPLMIISGTLNYDFHHHVGMGMTNVTLKLGTAKLARADYLGATPKPDSVPTQYDWSMDPEFIPAALQKTVDKNLSVILTKELYGG